MYKPTSTKIRAVQRLDWPDLLSCAEDLLEEQGGENQRLKQRISKIKPNIAAGRKFPYGTGLRPTQRVSTTKL